MITGWLKLRIARPGSILRQRVLLRQWLERARVNRRRALVTAQTFACVLGCVCALYLCLRSNGQLSTVPWLPRPIGDWADQHGRLRNLPAFFLLACPFLSLARSLLSRVWITLAVGVFGTLLELAEYFIPRRMVEWQDVAWTWTGVVAAFLCFEGVRRLIERSRPNIVCHQPS